MATESIDGVDVDLDRLPDSLKDIAPHVRRWATSDIDEREQRQEAAPTEDLASYWLAVSQRLPDIRAYLDGQPKDDPSAEALVVAWTAEAALEAARVIERRTGQPPPGGDPGA